MPYRTLGEDLVAFLEEAIAEAQKQRLRSETSKPHPVLSMSPEDRVIKMLSNVDAKKVGLIVHGDIVMVEREPGGLDLKVMVVRRRDGATATRRVEERELIRAIDANAIARLIAAAIRFADTELGGGTTVIDDITPVERPGRPPGVRAASPDKSAAAARKLTYSIAEAEIPCPMCPDQPLVPEADEDVVECPWLFCPHCMLSVKVSVNLTWRQK